MRVRRMQMTVHLQTTVVVVFVSAVVLALGGVGATARTARAAPVDPTLAAQAPNLVVAPTSLRTKVVLPETTIDGPALSSVAGTFEGQTFDTSVIGWTGTDAAHHVNVMTSTDGLHFSNKLILGQTSPFRPDVTQVPEPSGGEVTVAWTGTNASRSLNVLFDVYGSHPQKLTFFKESTFTAPAVLQIGGTIYLAWTGTNAGHSLNILPISLTSHGLVAGRKTTLSAFSSNAGPHLAVRSGNNVVLSWASRSDQLVVATSSDGVHFSTVATSVQKSAFAPSTVSFIDPNAPGHAANDWMGWTGTDSAHHLNLQFTSSFPSFPNSATKTVLGDTAFAGPVLAFIGFPQIAWTGTDAAHHLNIARFAMQ